MSRQRILALVDTSEVGPLVRAPARTDDRAAADAPGGAVTPASFQDLYVEHFGFVWRCLRGLGVAQGALDDAAQDVFVIVHRRLPEFRGESSARTWLYGILRNVAANQRRGARRSREVLGLASEPACDRQSPHQHVEDREAADFVQAFLATLDDKKREMFVLGLVERMTMPEVAAALGIPLDTAYTRLRSVKQAFARALAERSEAR